MNPSSTDFSLQTLEARFEMQYMQREIDSVGGDYGYYGSSWGNHGSGDGYVGTYQEASDGSGAMLDDGSYTDGSSGGFPTYDAYSVGRQPDGTCWPTYPCSQTSLCQICHC